MGAQMVKEVASKTSNDAGDGTTTATVYVESIFTEGLKNVAAGANPMELKRGIDAGVEAIVEEYKRMRPRRILAYITKPFISSDKKRSFINDLWQQFRIRRTAPT